MTGGVKVVTARNPKTLDITSFFGLFKTALYFYIFIDTGCISIQGRPDHAEKSAGGPFGQKRPAPGARGIYAKITDMLY